MKQFFVGLILGMVIGYPLGMMLYTFVFMMSWILYGLFVAILIVGGITAYNKWIK